MLFWNKLIEYKEIPEKIPEFPEIWHKSPEIPELSKWLGIAISSGAEGGGAWLVLVHFEVFFKTVYELLFVHKITYS